MGSVNIRRLPLVEQELLILPDHLSSPPVFSWVRFVRNLVFCVVFCRFVLFHLDIVLSVLRFTDSDYPFGIFKLFETESHPFYVKDNMHHFINTMYCL